MKYSAELIRKVKECYPDKPYIHKLAEDGNHRLMDEIGPSWGVVFVDLVLGAKSFKELKTCCKHVKLKEEVYIMISQEISANDNR